MAQYMRKTAGPGYFQITVVDDEGNYETRAEWPEGVVTSSYKSTLQEMGWTSIKDFLKCKGKRFVKLQAETQPEYIHGSCAFQRTF